MEITNKLLREFGLIFAGGLVLFFGILIPWIWDLAWPKWPWIAAAVFAGTGLIAPVLLKPVFIVWMKIGHALGWFNTRLILSIVFFLFFAPLALAFRIFGRDPMDRKLTDDVDTYRKPSEHLPRERMEKPF